MKKIIAIVLAIVLVFCVAVPVVAVKKLIDLKDHIVQVISDESAHTEELEPSEATEGIVIDEQTETTEEPIAGEQTEEYVASEQPEAPSSEPEEPSATEEPAKEEKLDYFGYLKKHITKGFERAKFGAMGSLLIPIAPFVGMFPVYGWMMFIVAFASPFIAVFGVGEMIFSPIIAGIELFLAR